MIEMLVMKILNVICLFLKPLPKKILTLKNHNKYIANGIMVIDLMDLEYFTEEKFYPLGTTDEYFEASYEEYLITICGQTIIPSKRNLPRPCSSSALMNGKYKKSLSILKKQIYNNKSNDKLEFVRRNI